VIVGIGTPKVIGSQNLRHHGGGNNSCSDGGDGYEDMGDRGGNGIYGCKDREYVGGGGWCGGGDYDGASCDGVCDGSAECGHD